MRLLIDTNVFLEVFLNQEQAEAARSLLSMVGEHDMFLVLSLPVNEVERVARATERFRLDFDDAYQYAVAEVHDLTIISLDSDFDRTIRGRMVPAQLLQRG
ncbi:MAG: PIN domain nuclease [Armatimonadota bacterium]|nr:MAG: PIN domain nuclease [Armatimonadota bacterium]